MKKKSKAKVLGGSALLIGLAMIGAGALTASADTTATTTAPTNPMSGLVSAIATKFNLNTTDVQSVFDAQRAQMDAQHTQAEAARLQTAVTNGKLTQAQANAITAKQAQMQATMKAQVASGTQMTQAQRQAQMTAQKADLKAWQTANGLTDAQMMYLGGMMGGHGGHGGFGGDHMRGGPGQMMPTSTTNTTTTTTN